MKWGIHLVVPRHRIGVSLVAFNDQQQVFMLRHVFHPYAPWGLPGGWMDGQESPAACLVRELKEETGLDARIGPVVHVIRDPKPDHLGIAYLGQLENGQIALSAEIMEAAWFPMSQLPEPIYPFVRLAIERAVAIYQAMPPGSWLPEPMSVLDGKFENKTAMKSATNQVSI